MEKALIVFTQMKQGLKAAPNVRTYNTLLKGHAKNGAFDNAIALSNDMKAYRLWDDVTTNTLVSAAITIRDFAFAETLLAKHSSTKVNSRTNHPNVEAYTELLDGYAKSGQLNKALGVLPLMRQRGVDPNAYTYTCIIGALARNKQVEEATSMLGDMEALGVKPTAVTYNALISGLVASSHNLKNHDAYEYGTHVSIEQDEGFDVYVDQAIVILKDMMQDGVRPNVVTVAILIEALGRCSRPRIDEAETLVAKLESNRIIPADNEKVKTAMIRACGSAGDLKASLNAFRGIRRPDVIAINAFMDAACRCGNDKFAFDTFDHFLGTNVTTGVVPDVISYSVLINSLLKKNSVMAASRAQKLYKQMRLRKITPDTALVDIILTAMVRGGRLGLQKNDIQFILMVLTDAEGLKWLPGQFQRRKQAVRTVMVGRSEAFKDNDDVYGMGPAVVDELFKKKGWNKVDSGFRLWGGGIDDPSFLNQTPKKASSSSVDEFLAAKGWNNVDSGFRIW
jgi:pentatricopeptide repeat protein